MEIMWRSDGISNPVGQEVRIIDLDGEKMIEMAVPHRAGFIKRLVACFNYLFKKKPFIVTFVLLDDKFDEMCNRVVTYGRENSKN